MQVLAYLLARFSEPSSYAGLSAVLALAGWHFSDTVIGQLVQLLAAGCGLAALFLKDRGLIRSIAVTATVPAALALGLALSACTSPGPTADTAASGVLPASDVQKLASLCAAAQPLLAAATAAEAPQAVSNTATYAQSFCQDLAAAVPAGQLPPTTDGNTPNWLPQVLTTVETVAKDAGYVLPVVAALAPLL